MWFHNTHKDFAGHLQDLRIFLIIAIIFYILCFGVCFYFAGFIYEFLANSFLQTLNHYKAGSNFITTAVPELFFTYLKIAFFTSLIIFVPVFLILLFLYLLPALKKVEKKIAIILLILIPTLFALGVFSAYYVSLQVIWQFFISFNTGKHVQILPKVNEYISLVLSILFAFGVSFELPIFMIILFLLNILTPQDILKYSRFAIVLAFIVGAVLTPPDPLSQILMASVLLILYFLSYFIILFISRVIKNSVELPTELKE